LKSGISNYRSRKSADKRTHQLKDQRQMAICENTRKTTEKKRRTRSASEGETEKKTAHKGGNSKRKTANVGVGDPCVGQTKRKKQQHGGGGKREREKPSRIRSSKGSSIFSS